MPLDRGSPLHRFRVDPRAARRHEIERLAALGVVMDEIAPARARPLFSRFVREFVDPSLGAQLDEELGRAGGVERAFELDRWLRPDRVLRGGGWPGCMRWLREGAGRSDARCVRFERRVHLPALSIDPETLEDAWAASWPGVFVSFDAARAVVITLDYEEVRCDLHGRRATPYR